MREVLDITGKTRPTVYRWGEEGRFPKRVQLGEASIGFPKNEVDQWVADKIRHLEKT